MKLVDGDLEIAWVPAMGRVEIEERQVKPDKTDPETWLDITTISWPAIGACLEITNGIITDHSTGRRGECNISVHSGSKEVIRLTRKQN